MGGELRSAGRAVCKTTASAAFVGLAVGLAVALGAAATPVVRWMLAAFVLSAIGDVCLLSERRAAFLAGLGAFLLAHVAGAMAFAASDLAVARDRFVAPGAGNRMWGLPLYYTARSSSQ